MPLTRVDGSIVPPTRSLPEGRAVDEEQRAQTPSSEHRKHLAPDRGQEIALAGMHLALRHSYPQELLLHANQRHAELSRLIAQAQAPRRQ